ncbi:MAG: DNA repair protein RadC [Lachnospiraceae bacterium]|nr:DNA repair protein RadC [Lachnospiraceae bacterium]
MEEKRKIWEEQLPYEKFEAYGPEHLSDAELIAILLRTGTKDCNSVELAKKILKLGSQTGQAHGLLTLQHLSLPQLMEIKGVGKVKAIRLKCVTELSKRMAMEGFRHGIHFDRPATVAGYYMEQLRHLEVEQVILVMTDNKNRFLRDMVLSRGTVNMSVLSPREIFLQAIRMQAVHILLVHNHPSGDPTPSSEDIRITRRVDEAAQILNIPLVDHIIIGDNTYASLKELGYLEKRKEL